MSDAEQQMQVLRYAVRFLTPAFLGNAEQAGQWRTPPFKALLRQWWRVVWATRHDPNDTRQMRADEGKLFGNAWLDGEHRKSEVRLRLSDWSQGQLTQENWRSLGSTRTSGRRPSRNARGGGGFDGMLYAGYGLLKSANEIERPRAISCDELSTISIALPSHALDDIRRALVLIDLYGALGGRSRNGWGSVSLEAQGENEAPSPAAYPILRPLDQALNLNWPHAIGQDQEGPLIWQTKSKYKDWRELMSKLGEIRKEIRKVDKIPKGGGRLPNAIRFKARAADESSSQLVGVAFHLPCKPGEKAEAVPSNDWCRLHKKLDDLLERTER